MKPEVEEGNELGDFLAGLDEDVEGFMKSVGLEKPDEEVGDPDEVDAAFTVEPTDDEGDEDDEAMAKAKVRSKKKKKKNKDEDDEDEDEDEEVETASEDEDEEFGKSIAVEGADPLLIAALNEIDDLRQQGRQTKKVLQKSAKVQAGMYTLLKGIAARFADELSEPGEPEADISVFGKSSRAGASGEKQGPTANEVLAKTLAAMEKGILSPVGAIAMQNAAQHGTMDEAQLATFERLNIALGTGQPS